MVNQIYLYNPILNLVNLLEFWTLIKFNFLKKSDAIIYSNLTKITHTLLQITQTENTNLVSFPINNTIFKIFYDETLLERKIF